MMREMTRKPSAPHSPGQACDDQDPWQEVNRLAAELDRKNVEMQALRKQYDQVATALDHLSTMFMERLEAGLWARISQTMNNVLPLLEQLKRGRLEHDRQQALAEAIKGRLTEAASHQVVDDRNPPKLSQREREVALFIVKGHSHAGTAELLGISRRCVESHCYSLRKKLAVPAKDRLKNFLMRHKDLAGIVL